MTRTVFAGGSVWDARSGVVSIADLVVEGDRIVEMGTGLDGDVVVDVSGRTLLPGLMDCHVHMAMSDFDVLRGMDSPFSLFYFEAVRNLRTVLDLGITTVRDAAGADAGMREAVATGLVLQPHLWWQVVGGVVGSFCAGLVASSPG